MANTGRNIFMIGGKAALITGLLSTFAMFAYTSTGNTSGYNWSVTLLFLTITIFIVTILFGLPPLIKD